MIGSVPDIAVVVLVGFVLFGAKNIPQIGKNLGQGLRAWKQGVSELKDDLDISKLEPKPAPSSRHTDMTDRKA
jgi:TatA/E family protein of Tat protein translocase